MKARRLFFGLLLIGAIIYFGIKFSDTFEVISENFFAVMGILLIALLLILAFDRILRA